MDTRSAILVILFPLFPFLLKSQCVSGIDAEGAIASGDLALMSTVAQQLSTCPDSVITLAMVYHSIGVQHFREGDLQLAIQATHQSLALREKALPAGDFEIGRSNNNLGVFYLAVNEHTKGIKHLRRSSSIYDALGENRAVQAYRVLAGAYFDRGDFDLALNYLGIALQKAREKNIDSEIARCLLDYGNIHLNKGEFQTAIDSLKLAESAFNLLPEKSYRLQNDEAGCYLNMAFVYDELKVYEDALNYYLKAKTLYEELELESEVASTLNNMAVVYSRRGDLNTAANLLDEALKMATDMPSLQAMCYDNLGDLYLDRGEQAKAIKAYAEAISSLLPQFDQGKDPFAQKDLLKDVSNKSDLLTYLVDMANALSYKTHTPEDRPKLEQALSYFKLTDFLTDIMRFEQGSTESKLFWRKQIRPMYASALDICYALGDHKQAFYFMEKSKAILLLDALLGINARTVVPDSIADQEFELQVRLQVARSELQDAEDYGESDLEPYRKAVADALESNELFLEQISADHPQYFEIKYRPEVVELGQFFEAQSGDEQYLIEYFFGSEYIYGLLAGKDSTFFFREKRTAIDNELNEYLDLFSARNKIQNDPAAYAEKAFSVYQLLFGNGLQQLLPEGASLVIIPDGKLNFLPFESLIHQKSEGTLLGTFPYLLHRYAISYGYSATILTEQTNELTPSLVNHDVIGFAPFAVKGTDLPVLVNSKSELENIKATYDGAFYFDNQASVEEFIAQAGLFSVIHLSTHASAETGQPFISFGESKLELAELYTLQLPAELVVLSACQTGLGTLAEGEGVMSLARGFTFAGSKRLISSLWSVNDASTASIFNYFYRHIGENKTSTEALRQAKMDYLKTEGLSNALKSPYFWAGFNMVGPGGPIELNEKSSGQIYVWMLLALVLLSISIFTWWKKRKSL
ncbi:MAG: CHAT domain-containing protein [Bacteroidota bacterium]